MILASGSLLSQDEITTSATPTLVFTASMRTEVTLILMANYGSNAEDLRIYHDDSGGSTYDATTLIYAGNVSGNETLQLNFFPGSGIVLSEGGQIAVEATGTTPDVTFAFYGTTEEIARSG